MSEVIAHTHLTVRRTVDFGMRVTCSCS